MLNCFIEEDKFQFTVIGCIVILLELLNSWYDFFEIRNLLIFSRINFQNIGEIDIAVSLSYSKINLK